MAAWRGSELGLSEGKLRAAVTRGSLVRQHRDVYRDGPADIRARVRALMLVLPRHAMVGFHTAADLYGFPAGQSGGPVHVMVQAGQPFPDIRGVATHQAVLPLGDPVLLDGIPCVPPDRCAIDLARRLKRIDALPVLDAALRVGRCTADSLDAELRLHDGLRGVRQARDLVPLADGRSECRQESQLRLIAVDGRLPAPEPQLWVYDDWGDPRYRLDLGWPDARVGGEYDGSSHLDGMRLRSDRQRHNWLESRGWHMRYFTAVDIYRRPWYVVSTLRQALGMAGALPPPLVDLGEVAPQNGRPNDDFS
jgi:hypothetical protein